jgi:hypothetical protein
MRRRGITRSLVLVAIAGVAATASPQSAPLVRCESIDGKGQECPMDTRWGVQLARQLGGSQCVAGKSWGWKSGAVWVALNCRGEFRGLYEEQPGEVVVTCDSDHNRVEKCPLATTAGFVVIPDDSSSKCVQGETWGWEPGSVWVSKRCEADFAAAAPRVGHAVRCEAPDSVRVECAVDSRGGVTLATEHRPTPCRFGENWGLSERGIWVDPTCGGTFQIDSRQHGGPSWSEPNRLVCGAPGVVRDFCPADTSRGVRLGVQTGPARCVENTNWGWSAQGIWAAEGCQAEFSIGR